MPTVFRWIGMSLFTAASPVVILAFFMLPISPGMIDPWIAITCTAVGLLVWLVTTKTVARSLRDYRIVAFTWGGIGCAWTLSLFQNEQWRYFLAEGGKGVQLHIWEDFGTIINGFIAEGFLLSVLFFIFGFAGSARKYVNILMVAFILSALAICFIDLHFSGGPI